MTSQNNHITNKGITIWTSLNLHLTPDPTKKTLDGLELSMKTKQIYQKNIEENKTIFMTSKKGVR